MLLFQLDRSLPLQIEHGHTSQTFTFCHSSQRYAAFVGYRHGAACLATAFASSFQCVSARIASPFILNDTVAIGGIVWSPFDIIDRILNTPFRVYRQTSVESARPTHSAKPSSVRRTRSSAAHSAETVLIFKSGSSQVHQRQSSALARRLDQHGYSVCIYRHEHTIYPWSRCASRFRFAARFLPAFRPLDGLPGVGRNNIQGYAAA